MRPTLITSRTNPLVKELRALAQKKERVRRGEFLVEGIQPVLQALASGADVRLLVVAPDLLTSAVAQQAVLDHLRGGGSVVQVSPAVLESFTEREHPSGLAAVVGIPRRTLRELEVRPDSIFVALYEVGNPGNLGAILRTADAVGASGVIQVGAATDPYAPAAVKASRGTLFTVPLVQLDSPEPLLEWCRSQPLRVFTATDQAEQDLWGADFQTPLVLVFGSEGAGLPDALALAGVQVRIPMQGQVDSLNLAVAGGVLLYEVKRRRMLES